MAFSDWYRNAVFYEIYLRSFKDSNGDGIGDLPGLISKLDYLEQLGIDCLWLLPFYPSPRKDDGYDIADYYSIDPVYGSTSDFQDLVEQVHRRKMRLIMDLVVNHTSDQHPWFQSDRSDPKSPYHDFYVWSDTDQLYRDARIIFVDTEKSNWAWDNVAKKYYWHRFYTSQPDLNYENPAVRAEMLKIMGYWLEMGIDGFRVDAVPYLFEEDGTNCENLPRTHEYLKEMRRFVDSQYPGKVLICEANQLPHDVVQYLGNNDEFNIAFHFPLMPKIFMALRSQSRFPIEETLRKTPTIPPNTQWGTFLRNHDELTLEMVTPEEREWMWKEYAPEPGMRLNLGIRRRLTPLLDNNKSKIELANAILFSLPGTPFLYYGDEIGMGDNINLPDRDGVRTPMQWQDSLNAGFSTNPRIPTPVLTDPEYAPNLVNVERQILEAHSLWHFVQKLIALRKQESVFKTNDLAWLPYPDPHVLMFIRQNREDRLLFLHNLGDKPIEVRNQIPPLGTTHLKDLLSDAEFEVTRNYIKAKLIPYQSLYLKPT